MQRSSRQSAPSRLLGPRALAVLSCALALLAAQPLRASKAATSLTPAVEVAEGMPAAIAPVSSAAESRSTKKNRPAVQANFLSSARRLHILATVEILHRLLLAELRPVERQLVAAFVFEPQTLISLEQPLLKLGQCAADPPDGLARDHAYAIEHCLLAPPVL